MAGDVHEMQVGFADELDFRGVEETVVIFADEAGVFDGFLGKFAHVGGGADDAHVVGIRGSLAVRQCNVLADEHTYAYAGHVEAVKESLDVGVDLHALFFAFVLEDALGDGCDDAVVPSFDAFEGLSKALIVICEFGRPVATIFGGCEVAFGRRFDAVAIAVAVFFTVGFWEGAVLALFDAWILSGLAQDFRLSCVGF